MVDHVYGCRCRRGVGIKRVIEGDQGLFVEKLLELRKIRSHGVPDARHDGPPEQAATAT
jgi:hypothetical protein